MKFWFVVPRLIVRIIYKNIWKNPEKNYFHKKNLENKIRKITSTVKLKRPNTEENISKHVCFKSKIHRQDQNFSKKSSNTIPSLHLDQTSGSNGSSKSY